MIVAYTNRAHPTNVFDGSMVGCIDTLEQKFKWHLMLFAQRTAYAPNALFFMRKGNDARQWQPFEWMKLNYRISVDMWIISAKLKPYYILCKQKQWFGNILWNDRDRASRSIYISFGTAHSSVFRLSAFQFLKSQNQNEHVTTFAHISQCHLFHSAFNV